MNKGRKPAINGKWLEEALEAQGYNLHSAAKLIGVESRILYAHKAGQTTISTGILFALCSALPTLSERYVLTGRGPKIVLSAETDENLLLESFQIKKSIERILHTLTS
ncbi:hypothetical protein [Spirosoma aerolatum]|uniref:hypothetical protein n=1 Tax=Spirosoma aerolatum TaxID=1211326 RepID=UPI0009AE201A|nr:hypothetical protein [Spirosoma aerolatum]